ncbi:MAG: GHKL domain-containing protein [Defluviitaleaceae bacterium]|nr:GHKL domain-containing protein [Defluviitaleaceae bacterium]
MLALQYLLIFLMMHLIIYNILNFEKVRSIKKANCIIFLALVIFDIIRQFHYGYQPVRTYDTLIALVLINGLMIYSAITTKRLIILLWVPFIYLLMAFISSFTTTFVFTLIGVDTLYRYTNPIHSLAGLGLGTLSIWSFHLIVKKLGLQLNIRTLNKTELVFIVFFIGIFGYYVDNLSLLDNQTWFRRITNSFALISGFGAIYSIVYLIATKNEVQRVKNNEQQQLEINQQQQFHYQKMQERDSELRRFRHDIKNELIALEALLKSNAIDCALKTIREMVGDLDKIVKTTGTETGAIEINANLLALESNSQFKGLKADWKGVIPSNLTITPRDLSNLFSNLLKNAFEAASQVETDKGYVTVTIRTDTNRFRIQVENNFKGELSRYPNGDLMTSKADKLNHGFGTKTIKRIVKKYGGITDFKADKDKFIATISFDGAIYKR